LKSRPVFSASPLKISFALAACFLAAAPLSAKKPRSGIPSPDFDGKTVGARFTGLGESGTALPGMPESPLWNPASLITLQRPLFAMDFDLASQSRLDQDVIFQSASLGSRKLTYLGFAGEGGAFYFRPLASYNRRTVTNAADPANNFIDESLKINQIGLAVAQKGSENYSVGLGISYINARRGMAVAQSGQPPALTLADGNGFTADLGFLIREENLSFGVAAFNIPGIVYWNEYRADQLPTKLRIGAAFQPVPAFLITTDYEKRYYRGGNLTRPSILHWGLELTPFQWLALRGGTFGRDLNDVDKTFYTAGFSVVSQKSHQLDFAFKTYRLNKERVYNYGVSVIIPIQPPAGR
jgi:hypothetical protein